MTDQPTLADAARRMIDAIEDDIYKPWKRCDEDYDYSSLNLLDWNEYISTRRHVRAALDRHDAAPADESKTTSYGDEDSYGVVIEGADITVHDEETWDRLRAIGPNLLIQRCKIRNHIVLESQVYVDPDLDAVDVRRAEQAAADPDPGKDPVEEWHVRARNYKAHSSILRDLIDEAAAGWRRALEEVERLCVHGAEPTSEEWHALREQDKRLREAIANNKVLVDNIAARRDKLQVENDALREAIKPLVPAWNAFMETQQRFTTDAADEILALRDVVLALAAQQEKPHGNTTAGWLREERQKYAAESQRQYERANKLQAELDALREAIKGVRAKLDSYDIEYTIIASDRLVSASTVIAMLEEALAAQQKPGGGR